MTQSPNPNKETPEQELDLDDIFESIRQTCDECEHPRCRDIVKTSKKIIATHYKAREAEPNQAILALLKKLHNVDEEFIFAEIEDLMANYEAKLSKDSQS